MVYENSEDFRLVLTPEAERRVNAWLYDLRQVVADNERATQRVVALGMLLNSGFGKGMKVLDEDDDSQSVNVFCYLDKHNGDSHCTFSIVNRRDGTLTVHS